MSADCCSHGVTFEGLSTDYKRRLWIVIAINASMFLVEMAAGALAGSQALQADALDFLGDATTYAISLAVIGTSIQIRARAAILKAISLTAEVARSVGCRDNGRSIFELLNPDFATVLSRNARNAPSSSQVAVAGQLTSALGQKQTSAHDCVMSALPPKADIGTKLPHVRLVPKAAVSRCIK
jgi:hypothetical protein